MFGKSTLKPIPTQSNDVRDELRHRHDDLQMHSNEPTPLTKLEVAAHQQIQQPAGFAPRRRQTGVAASKDLVAKRAAKERIAAEEQSREFADKSPQGGERVPDDRLALKRRVQERDENVEQFAHLEGLC